MNARNWLVQVVQYYRRNDFFEQYNHLSDEQLADELESLCREDECTSGRFFWMKDWEVIRYDNKRTLTESLDLLYGDDPGSYSFHHAVAIIQKWASISRDVFQPTAIRDTGTSLIEFTLNGKRCTVNPWEDPRKLAPQLNSLIAHTNYQFEIWKLDPTCLVTVLTIDEKAKFQAEREWLFFNR